MNQDTSEENAQTRPPNRRGAFLVIGGLFAGALGFGAWLRRRPSGLIEQKPAHGFRRFSSSEITGAVDPFIGLSGGFDPLAPDHVTRSQVGAAPCIALYGHENPLHTLAIFTDFNCPICRRFEAEIAEMDEVLSGELTVRFLDLPLLGPQSVGAAQMALAGEMNGVEDEMRTALKRSRSGGDMNFAFSVEDRLGIDAFDLIADAESLTTLRRLQKNRALAEMFGIIGTPGFAIGDTVVLGAVNPAGLRWVIDQARQAPCG